MSLRIKKYNGFTATPEEGEHVFFVQSVGFNAGRPLKKPLTNSWEVRTNRSIDFEILYLVFVSRILEPFIVGSVIPFIRLSDYKGIIFPILKNALHDDGTLNAKYLQIQKIEERIQNQKKIIDLLQQLKKVESKKSIGLLKKRNLM